jgi:hypothetical protein
MTSSLWRCARALSLVTSFLAVPHSSSAEAVRFDITSRGDVARGQSFGSAGPYEKLAGKVHFAVDPALPQNRAIVDLDKAPRNTRGLVEFSADVYILRPKDVSKGNGVAFFDVLNRGRKLMLGYFNRADASDDPAGDGKVGDGFLMRQGYTLVWIGWQFDAGTRAGLMGLDAPVATDNGQPIVGWVTAALTPVTSSAEAEFVDVRRYAPLDVGSREYRLVEREGALGTPRPIARDDWSFGRVVDGRSLPDPSHVTLKSGFRAGLTYELSYQTKDAVVSGLGFTTFRDLASAMKFDATSEVKATHAYVFGASQSGRFLRSFVYDGFNTDEKSREVFDGFMIHIAGAGRLSINERFAQPNSLGFFSATKFPFLDSETRDPLTGQSDALQRKFPAGKRPKVIYTNSSVEYWGGGRVAALTHTTIDGKADAPEPDNVRIYHLAGTQHGSGSLPAPDTGAQLRGNPSDYRWPMRRLAVALDAWVRRGQEPPPSRHATISARTLVPHTSLRFPAVPGVKWPTNVPVGYRGDREPFTSHPLPLLVSQVDADGNEVGGLRLPELAVPLATVSGWAFRSERLGAPTELLALAGSYLPFAPTKAARQASGDPRPSIEERYVDRADYLRKIDVSARQLVKEGYVLEDDVAGILERATQHWDLLMGAKSPTSSGR